MNPKPTRWWRRWHVVQEPFPVDTADGVHQYSLGVWRECVPLWALPLEIAALAWRDLRVALDADPWAQAVLWTLARFLFVLVAAYVLSVSGCRP